MSLVTLVSGGLDSTVMSVLSKQEGLTLYPLFVDYGQICVEKEWEACVTVHAQLALPRPERMDLNGFGGLIRSGLTDSTMRVNEDAFLPGRNLLFLLAGCAYACMTNSNAVAIGLLSETNHIFPDQTSEFITKAEGLMNLILFRRIKIIAPLMEYEKVDMVKLAKKLGVGGTYSCHSGTTHPCGVCVSCRELETNIDN